MQMHHLGAHDSHAVIALAVDDARRGRAQERNTNRLRSQERNTQHGQAFSVSGRVAVGIWALENLQQKKIWMHR